MTEVRAELPIRRRQIFLRAENHSLAQHSLARLPHWMNSMDATKRELMHRIGIDGVQR
jgi:hypothetical protein